MEKEEIQNLKTGQTVRVHQKIKEGDKERTQIFEGMILKKKGGNQKNATIMVRKISEGIGVEKIFPLYSPTIPKIEVIKQANTRKSKLYYLRTYKKKLKEKVIK